MVAAYKLDDVRSLQKKLDEKAYDLFKAKKGQAPLQVTRIFRRKVTNSEGEDEDEVTSVKDEDVPNTTHIEALRRDLDDLTQIFTIRQDRSWTTLNISLDIFTFFMEKYKMAPSFLRCMFTFGRKSEENEFEFPGFTCRRRKQRGPSNDLTSEMSYVLRRVELNGRGGVNGESPWSIRQTAVYHKLSEPQSSEEVTNDDQGSRSMFLLVAPSNNVKWQLGQALGQDVSDVTTPLSCWNVHRILLSDALKGWADYMSYLEKKLKELSDALVLATVRSDNDTVRLSSLSGFNINFVQRQELEILEEKVMHLQVILPGMVDAIVGVKKSCLLSSASSTAEGQDERDVISGELEEYSREAKTLAERAKILTAKAMSGARMVSDLLSHEGTNALKNLAMESQAESTLMRELAEKSTRDASAVKTLTVITLIYLPTSIVANFFSTEFVQTDGEDHMRVTTNVWILAAISIPLTLLTIFVWWGWGYLMKGGVNYRLKDGEIMLHRQRRF